MAMPPPTKASLKSNPYNILNIRSTIEHLLPTTGGSKVARQQYVQKHALHVGIIRNSAIDAKERALRLSPRGDVEAGLLVFVLDVDMASALLVEQHLAER